MEKGFNDATSVGFGEAIAAHERALAEGEATKTFTVPLCARCSEPVRAAWVVGGEFVCLVHRDNRISAEPLHFVYVTHP